MKYPRCTMLVLATAMTLCCQAAQAAPGLLLIAHGSPSPQWNQPVLELGKRIAEEVRQRGGFQAVRTALLEAAEPDIPTAVAELEAEGCDRIVAVPLFVACSGHTHFDVPAALGVFTSARTARVLAAENAVAAQPHVPITLTATLSEGDVLKKFALAEVRRLSQSPKEEAVVFLAHGDPEHHLLVERQLREVSAYCCGETGISSADWAYIGVGQEYLSNGVPAIEAASQQRKRVLVVGLYLSTTAQKIHDRITRPGPHAAARANPLEGRDVVFSSGAIIDHGELTRWALESAYAAVAPPAVAAR